MAVPRATQHELTRRAATLAALVQHPSWPEMEAEMGRKIERLKRTASIVALQDDGADQRKLDQIRGTIAALNWFLGVPVKATSSLERFLSEQLEMEDEDE